MEMLIGLIIVGLTSLGLDEPEPADLNGYESIEVRETQCYGWCPDYTIVMTPDDAYALHGRNYVRVPGESRGELEPGSFARMVAILEEERFNALPASMSHADTEHCRAVATDSPSFRLTVVRAGEEKSVSWYLGCAGSEQVERIARIREALLLEFDRDARVGSSEELLKMYLERNRLRQSAQVLSGH